MSSVQRCAAGRGLDMAPCPQPDSCLLGSPLGLLCLSLLSIPAAGASSCPQAPPPARAPPSSCWPPGCGVASGAIRWQVTTDPWPCGPCLCSWNLLRVQPWPQPRGPHCPAGGAGGCQRQLLLRPRHCGDGRHSSQGVREPRGQGGWMRASELRCPSQALGLAGGGPSAPGRGHQGLGNGVSQAGLGRGVRSTSGLLEATPTVPGLTSYLCSPVKHALDTWTAGE